MLSLFVFVFWVRLEDWELAAYLQYGTYVHT